MRLITTRARLAQEAAEAIDAYHHRLNVLFDVTGNHPEDEDDCYHEDQGIARGLRMCSGTGSRAILRLTAEEYRVLLANLNNKHKEAI